MMQHKVAYVNTKMPRSLKKKCLDFDKSCRCLRKKVQEYKYSHSMDGSVIDDIIDITNIIEVQGKKSPADIAEIVCIVDLLCDKFSIVKCNEEYHLLMTLDYIIVVIYTRWIPLYICDENGDRLKLKLRNVYNSWYSRCQTNVVLCKNVNDAAKYTNTMKKMDLIFSRCMDV